jgi:hypothetical protein
VACTVFQNVSAVRLVCANVGCAARTIAATMGQREARMIPSLQVNGTPKKAANLSGYDMGTALVRSFRKDMMPTAQKPVSFLAFATAIAIGIAVIAVHNLRAYAARSSRPNLNGYRRYDRDSAKLWS